MPENTYYLRNNSCRGRTCAYY